MANGLDRLERLFSGRKKSAPTRTTADANLLPGSVPDSSISPAAPDAPPSLFPQAPFIRPRCNVMYARDELDIYSQKPSLPPLDRTSPDDMADHQRRPTSFSTTASFHVPNRSSSLLSRRHNRIPTGLVQLSRETSNSSARPLPLRIHKHNNRQIGLLEALPIYPKSSSRVETPPPSDQDDFNFPSPPTHHAPPSSISTMLTQLTPEPSPDMIPCRSSTTSSDLRRESLLSSLPPSKRVTASSVPLLDDDWRDSYVHPPPESVTPEPNPLVFDEPNVTEFLSLHDDDLAEIKDSSPSKPPTKRAPPPPILPPNVRHIKPLAAPVKRRSMALRSPIMACNEVAAWEAARIAKKYDFDVVYVANFWPSGMNHLHNPQQEPSSAKAWQDDATLAPSLLLPNPETPRNSLLQNSVNVHGELSSPVSDCCPNSAAATPRTLTRLNGCLLAGYGLETIQAPFCLSARLHKKILRSEGWIEHRNSDAKDNEFARGYARSFYTGTVTPTTATTWSSQRRASAPPNPCTPTQNHEEAGGGARRHNNNKNSKKINRGIVFVAFRRPRGHGGTVHSSHAELKALGREAETLVELILDFHEERRRWEILQEARKCA